MYIDTIPNRKSSPAILLRESYRKNGKVMKRTLANLSKLPADKIDKIQKALFGKSQNNDFSFDEVTSGPIYGTLYVLNKLAEECGITKALGKSKKGLLSMFLILARIAHQGSRLSATRWAKDHATKEILGLNYFDEDDLYDALDWICLQQEDIEKKLFENYIKQQGEPPTLFLYDVTSSYLEGEQNELANYGYNRDGKKGKKQIVIGLLTAKDGEPLSVEVFEGNTSDTLTMDNQVDKLAQRFGVTSIVFVGDRGMIKSQGKQKLEENHFKYITAITDPQIRKLINKNVIQPSLFDEEIVEVEYDKKRLILRCNPATKRKEDHRCEDKINRLKEKIKERNNFVLKSKKARPESGLKNLQSWIKDYKISSFISLKLNGRLIEYSVDENAKNNYSLLNGCYCLESNISDEQLSSEEIHERYMDLQKVERNFRKVKTSLLEIRPLFLRNENRTRGHVLISMLALKIVRLMEKRLQKSFGTTDDDKNTENLESSLTAISRLCLHKYKIGEEEIVGLPRPDSRQEKILSALKIKINFRSK